MALIDEVTAYYKMDDASGGAEDAHGSNDLSQGGTVSYGETGIINDAMTADGNPTDYLEDTNFTWNADTNSISFWFKGHTNGTFMMCTTQDGADAGFKTYYTTNQLNAGVSDSGYGGSTATKSWTYDNTTWHHFVAIFDDPDQYIYVDGVKGNDGSWDGRSMAEGNLLWVFRDNSNRAGQFYIDEIAIFTGYALTATDISNLYNSGAGWAYPFSAAAETGLEINVDDAWKTVSAVKVNVDDAWKAVSAIKINVDDSWKTVM